jgi:hypothetical protein
MSQNDQPKPPDSESGGSQHKQVHAFIIKNRDNSLAAAEQFLIHRGWKVGSSHLLKTSLAYIVKNKPDMVFVPADHPNKKIRMLPKLLQESFGITVIGYAENGSPTVIAVLQSFKLEYIMYPPISGPTIERLINRMQRDENRNLGSAKFVNNTKVEGSEPDDETLVFKTEKPKDNSEILMFGKDKQKGSDIAGIASDGEDEDALIDLSSDRSSKEMLAETGKDEFGNLILKNKRPTSSQSSSQNGEDEDDELALFAQLAKLGKNKNQASDSNPTSTSDFDLKKGGNGEVDARLDTGPKSANESKIESADSGADHLAPSGAKEKNTDGKLDAAGSASTDGKLDVGATPSTDAQLGIGKKRNDSVVNDTLMVKGTQSALDQTVNVTGGEAIKKIDKVSNCACIIVESSRFNGYLIAAAPADMPLDKSFYDNIRKRLFDFLKAHGENLKEGLEESMGVKLQEVEFEGWAVEQAEFLRKAAHNGNEVAVAFFPTPSAKLELEQSHSEKMLKVEMDELRGDIPVEFDLYIYMPENQKYILYTPQGKTLYNNQRQRLTDKGVTHMHLRKDSTAQVKRYRAQNFLNDKIKAYRDKKVSASA